ncbi:PLP-dependent aminotransferase family protein [Sphaerisporangium sp. TRM90804]|uniref:MocR-like pyridoxine biosynthesis transcription factor PdxR n=1 Tax=Sphaerisporangium sp. TRM90804 TaxID=3031113 RepID=UPI00244CE830|nr:PLP-dependent aminotransferase family protein [Sphaerisporangium sp. TRM90804]MDH2429062.1 PLP-dependent aminotransferase family protein [Sphaerisporangium sp. TRM90804]
MRDFVDLPLALDRGAPVALAVQLGDQLRGGIRAGALKAGERLPSSRGLALLLGVSRTVVTEAFQQLYAEGWLEGRHGSGTYVADLAQLGAASPAPAAATRAAATGASAVPAAAAGHPDGAPGAELPRPGAGPDGQSVPAPAGMVDLRPGKPWVRDYDQAAWRRAWRAAAGLPPADFVDPYGHPRLRELLAEHLRRARAVPVGPENVMVTRGTGHGLDLIAAALLRPGDRAGVEEPGYRVARTVFASRGGRVVPCPVDAQGVVPEGLPAGLRVLFTTPAHQFPLGGRLPIPRRERLLAWARSTGATVVEDDYDAEFRYDVAPLPALYGLDPERVVLLGTLSKSLAPNVGIGWLVAAPPLLARIAALRGLLGDRTSGPVQEAVSLLLERGDLDRHLRRMRLEYARRRAAIVELLGPRVSGDSAGLHVFLPLPPERVDPLIAAAAARGVLLDTTARHHHGPVRTFGLVVGYGSASLADVRRACAVLAGLIDGG